MSSERRNVENIFWSALEIESKEYRQDFLDKACAENAALRAQVDEMLVAYENADDFMEHPPHLAALSDRDSAKQLEMEPTRPPKRYMADTVATTEQLPRRFGDYELLEKLAHGGMGMVYKARQTSLNRIVAVKMILAGQFASQDEVKRFYIEAEAAGHLDHPGIVPIFDVGSYDGQHYFAMGFVDGETLAERLRRGPLQPREAAMCVKKIAAAVQVAHEHGIVHRDLKPGNVLLTDQDEPRVTDFGLAKRVEADSDLTATGMVIGTPSYMPPEQAAGKLDQINAAADIYSLGAILYALLTGRPPFDASTQVDTLLQVMEEEPVAPRQFVSTVPRDLEVICLKCLEKDPVNRYRSAAELADDLQRFLAGEPIGAKNDLARRLRKWTLREPVLAAQLAAIAAMMAIIPINFLAFGHAKDSLAVLQKNELILVVWAIVVFAMQKIHNVIASKNVIPLIWAATNPLFLTAALAVNEAPREILFSLYLLLIITMGFFRRVELVVITTVVSLIGYVAMLIIFAKSPADPPVHNSYKVMFGVILVVSGLILGFQVLRLKRISQKDKT